MGENLHCHVVAVGTEVVEETNSTAKRVSVLWLAGDFGAVWCPV